MTEALAKKIDDGRGAIWASFRRSKRGVLGLWILLGMLLVGVFAPMLANRQPIACRYQGEWYFPAVVETVQGIPLVGKYIRKDKPFRLYTFDFKREYDPERDWALFTPVPWGPLEIDTEIHAAPSRRHWLGTDSMGQDVLARLIHGTRVSMKVGFIAMGIAGLIGLTLGALAGYFRGWIDVVISRVIEVVICFPTFFLVLAVLAWFPPRLENVMIVLGLTRWTSIARMTRGEFLRLRDVEYCLAARALGAGSSRVMFRHLLPNSLAPALVDITFGMAAAILVETALSWLGLGVQPPNPSWGNVLKDGYGLRATTAHIIPSACVAIFIAVLAFNLVGDALRDAIDPTARERGSSRPGGRGES